MTKLVIDADICAKWFLNDEEHVKEAVDLRDAFIEGRVELLAPHLLPVEWANAINVAIIRERFPEQEWPNALKAFEDLEIPLTSPPGLLYKAWRLARQYNRTIYDSVYLALAEEERCELVTGDKKLADAVRNDLHWVKWIGELKCD